MTRPMALITVYRLPLLLLIVLQRLVGKASGAGAGAAEPDGMDMAQWEQESVELSGGVASRVPSLVPSARDLWPPGWGGPISRVTLHMHAPYLIYPGGALGWGDHRWARGGGIRRAEVPRGPRGPAAPSLRSQRLL